MKRTLLSLVLLASFPLFGFAEGSAPIALSKAPLDASNIESIKRGATFFASNCVSCHTMVYLRYNKLAQEAGLTYEKMPVNVKSWPNGITPPDLSLETDVRGEDWVYTYLHSFYQDPTRPSGVNNLLVPNTAMPGIITVFQGTQIRVEHPAAAPLYHSLHWYDLLVLQKQGTLSPDQFDATITDLVNFLSYAAHPYEAQQNSLGWWVLGFLLIFAVLAVYLKAEYWKDIKKKH